MRVVPQRLNLSLAGTASTGSLRSRWYSGGTDQRSSSSGELMRPSQIAQSSPKAEGRAMVESPSAGYTGRPDEMPLAGYATLRAEYGSVFGALFRKLSSR